MKRCIFILSCLLCMTLALPSRAAMSLSEIRENARFISDRMGYELQLTNAQYNDVYEINYDFLSSIRYLTDNLAYGYDSDVDQYYEYLDLRNEDLSYVLTRSQYLLFMGKEYFYRPLYISNSRCTLRIYSVYPNRTFFYFGLPVNFHSYAGVHNRSHYRNGFYVGRYSHERYSGAGRSIRSNNQSYATHRWNDFRVPMNEKRSNNTKSHSNGYTIGGNRYNNGNNSVSRPNTSTSRPNNSVSKPNESTGRPNNSVSRPNTSTSKQNNSVSKPNESTSRPNNSVSRPNTSTSKQNDSGNNNRGHNREQRNGKSEGRR